MEIITSDAVGLAAVIRAAELIAEILDEHNVRVGVIKVDGEDHAIGIAEKRGDMKVLATVERKPKVVRVSSVVARDEE
jgi:hypothetical protein